MWSDVITFEEKLQNHKDIQLSMRGRNLVSNYIIACALLLGHLQQQGNMNWTGTRSVEDLLTGIFRNSVKSVLRFLQHDHPLSTSWNTGAPGWYLQASEIRNSHDKFQLRGFESPPVTFGMTNPRSILYYRSQ